MEKWADYCVSAVSYDDRHVHIIEVYVHVDNGKTIEARETWSRKQVVQSIDSGKTFVTIAKDRDRKWRKGERVRVVSSNGAKYIRTDANARKGDNLGELPEF